MNKDKEIQRLRWEKLKLRLEIEQLVFWPDSRAAEKIRTKYRKKKAIRDEVELIMKN